MKHIILGKEIFNNASFLQETVEWTISIRPLEVLSNYEWYINDVKISTDYNLVHTFTDVGVYKIVLKAVLTTGSSLSYTEYVSVVTYTPDIIPYEVPWGQTGTPYSAKLMVVDGTTTGKNLQWYAENLPDGLSINKSTGEISGVPTELGPKNFIVTVRDSLGSTLISHRYLIQITIGPPLLVKEPLPHGWVPENYYYQFKVYPNSGYGTLTWTATPLTGSFPQGITWNATTHSISGHSLAEEVIGIRVRVTDSSGRYDEHVYTYESTDVRPRIKTTELPHATQSYAYSYNLYKLCGTGSGPVTWKVDGLPSHMTYSAKEGIIYGVSTVAGSYPLQITLTDNQGRYTTSALTLVVDPLKPEIEINSIVPARVGEYYENYLYAKIGFGNPPYSWTFGGNLPSGFTAASTGLVKGTCVTSGRYPVSVQITDSLGVTSINTVVLRVDLEDVPPPIDGEIYIPEYYLPPQVETQVIPDGKVGQYYQTLLKTVDVTGIYPLEWAVSGLPSGLTLRDKFGLIVGVPTVAGDFYITITVKDLVGNTDTREHVLKIYA